MSVASSSSMRALRLASAPRFARAASTYQPSSSSSVDVPPPRARPASPSFFTGKPTYHDSLASLQSSLKSAQTSLRAAHVYPLPSSLPMPQPPRASWVSSSVLSTMLGTQLRTNTHREVVELLNELHAIRHLADLAGMADVASSVDSALERYERPEKVEAGKQSGEGSRVDELRRAYATGRRKESSARVWMIANPKAAGSLDVSETPEYISEPPISEVLVNHLPLSAHFVRPCDRETVLRPLRITGLLGAYNIFALTRGGGTTGQAGAVALAVARALAILREDVGDVLKSDGALMRDTRMVERKKTGKPKARKAYTWVKR
ncbi:hypothetical protein JCM24511_08598 [Saitozyma sp. JCM 24511]|nr:hypothetical protein JCM24511_08598 [Saitozyma sp. JCM 24511]